ncbi:hypothetical protein ACSBR2_000128 [Camellia fascicularis]
MGKLSLGGVLDCLCLSSNSRSCFCMNSLENQDEFESKPLVASKGGNLVKLKDVLEGPQTLAFQLKPKKCILPMQGRLRLMMLLMMTSPVPRGGNLQMLPSLIHRIQKFQRLAIRDAVSRIVGVFRKKGTKLYEASLKDEKCLDQWLHC